MRGLLAQHATLASFLILFLEDLGIPMPIPADMVIMYAGYRAREHLIHPAWVVFLLLFAVCSASTILYAVVRAGGRPLVDRYGRYLHLNEARLARAEVWVRKRGVLGIIVSRSIPGVRLATVISCGLFRVPLRRFLPAQVIGTLIYMMFFFLIGYLLGPQAVEHIRLPAHSLQILLMVVVAVAVPLALRSVNRSTRDEDTRAILLRLTGRQRDSASLLAGFCGTVELALIWGTFATLANLTQRHEVQHATRAIMRWLASGADVGGAAAYALDYVVMLLLGLLASLVYFRWVLPQLHLSLQRLFGQILTLWLFFAGLMALGVAAQILHHVSHPDRESLWYTPSGVMVIAIFALGLLGYAYVSVEIRRLAVDRYGRNGLSSQNGADVRPTI